MINVNCRKHGHHDSWCTTPTACKTRPSPDHAGSVQAEQERFGVHPLDAQHARHLRHIMEAEGDH